jgi:hypothetical protein
LALGIGASTAVFTAHKSIVLRSLDARDPEAMVNVALIRQSGAFLPEHLTISQVGAVVSQRTATTESGFGKLGRLASGASNAEFASVFAVSENDFKVLGSAALRGRTFESIPIAELDHVLDARGHAASVGAIHRVKSGRRSRVVDRPARSSARLDGHLRHGQLHRGPSHA